MTSTAFAPPQGLLLTPLDEVWVAYSPLSGETMVINNETASILEVLRERCGDLASVCEALAREVDLDPVDVAGTIGAAWKQLIEAGLIAPTSPAG